VRKGDPMPYHRFTAPDIVQHTNSAECLHSASLRGISTANARLRARQASAVRDKETAMSDSDRKNGLTYADAGVDIDAGNLMVDKIKPMVRLTRRAGADGEIGGFGGLFDLKAAGFKDPILVAANDGVGTKLRVAIEAGRHDTVGIDLVAMCVNDLVVQGAEPLFFLDYFATGRLDPDQGAAIVKGIAEGCVAAGCALIGGETAEMPGMYSEGDYDLAGFAVGAAERGSLPPKAIWYSDWPRQASIPTGFRWFARSSRNPELAGARRSPSAKA
jgi:hypothetical protein